MPTEPRAARSLRSALLGYVLPPLLLLWTINAITAYQSIDATVSQAYDRTLLASARSIGERVDLRAGQVRVDVPWVALDTFDADVPGRIYYVVTGVSGEFVSGYNDFPALPKNSQRSPDYPALVFFRNDRYQQTPIRVAALFQPVVGLDGSSGVALIQVGETLEARSVQRSELLLSMLWRQGLLVSVSVLLVFVAVYAAVTPLRRLSRSLSEDGTHAAEHIEVPREIRPLVAALRDYMQRLDAANSKQRRFLADASHQLRTPLSVMMTQIEHTLESADPNTLREGLTGLKQSTRAMVRLSNQLLALARVEALARGGEPLPDAQLIDAVELARSLCLEFAPRAVQRQIALSFDSPEQPVWLRGELTLLHEALLNLLDNALRYTSAGGEVQVAVEVAAGLLLLTVCDDGPGIPNAQRERVFERFVRLPSGPTSGSGLGLGIVRDVIIAHAGQIELLDGLRKRGLCVRISLPLARMPAS